MAKARKKILLRRKRPKRLPYKIVLIVCEGTKTEPHYFCEFCRKSKLDIEITPPDKGTDPLSIVKYATNRYKKDNIEYDAIYCVFDKDTHTTYPEALEEIKKFTNIYAINSVPCFEYWLLLHFKYTLKDFKTKEVINELKKHIHDYQKNAQGIYGKTENDLDKAIVRAKRAEKEGKKTNTDHPSTKVYKLVEDLIILKKASQLRPYNSPK